MLLKFCVGSSLQRDPSGECAFPYRGNLCQDCVDNFSKEKLVKCSKCPEPTANAIKLTLSLLAFIANAGILIFSTLGGVHDKVEFKMHSIYLRILTNYFQVVSLIFSFSLF